MKISTLALFLGSALVVSGAGLGLVACSSDSNTGTPGGGTDSGSDSASHNDGSMSADTGMGNDTGSMTDGSGGDGGCTHGNPPGLHPSDGGAMALFCGFKPNDGGTLYCDPHTQLCCVGGSTGTHMFADPQCIAAGGTCMNGMNPKPIACEAPQDCPTAGDVCCMTGPVPALDPTCNYYRTGAGISTACATSCAAGTSQICTSNAECPMGKTCTPFKTIYFGLGFCQ